MKNWRRRNEIKYQQNRIPREETGVARDLTPEQIQKKREAQARWRDKQRKIDDQKSDSIQTIDTDIPTRHFDVDTLPLVLEETSQRDISLSMEEPEIIKAPMEIPWTLIFQGCLCISITSLLIFFQAEAYSNTKTIEPLNIAVSMICEISLLYLSGSLSRSFVSSFLFCCLFAYNIAVMSFAVLREETKKVATEITEDPKEVMKRSIFERAISSYDLSASKKETWNTTKILKIMRDISTEPEIKEVKPMVELYKVEAFGLIILRAILMLLNAVLIHRILNTKQS